MIVITGMHRSGTSLVSMTLDAFGVDFGDHSAFYAADQWNEEGYFERRDIVDLNSRLITGFSRTTGPVSSGLSQVGYLLWSSEGAVRRRAERMRSRIEDLSDRLRGLAVKDPRFCLTLPAWASAVESCVVCLRPPAEVALSLKRRQRIPLQIGFGFWDRHARGLLEHAPADSLYVDFTELAGADPLPELRRLAAHFRLGLGDEELQGAFHRRFNRRLKNFGEESVPVPRQTQALWAALSERHGAQ